MTAYEPKHPVGLRGSDEPKHPVGLRDSDEPKHPVGLRDSDEPKHPVDLGDSDEPKHPVGLRDSDEPRHPADPRISNNPKHPVDPTIGNHRNYPNCRCIIHIDADAFYATVEQRDNPHLKGKPVIISHDPKSRGVVSTCSYEARAFGVHSAMPAYQAYRLCPKGIFVKPRMKRYEEVSAAMFNIFERYSPLVEKLSVDEAFLDVTGDDGAVVAISIRKQVEQELGITVSAGVSYCKYLAKLASDSCKPDGFRFVGLNEAPDFLENLPVSSLPGIGPKTQEKLLSFGISTVGALRQMPENWFVKIFGKTAKRFHDMCNGIDDDPVTPWREVKSISEETTFDENIKSMEALKRHLAELAQNVAFRLRKAQLRCRTVGIKIRFDDFTTITREQTLPESISADAVIFGRAKTLLLAIEPKRPIRLLGVAAKGLEPKIARQKPLFEHSKTQWDDISPSIDLLRNKYGKPVVFLGASLERETDSKTR